MPVLKVELKEQVRDHELATGLSSDLSHFMTMNKSLHLTFFVTSWKELRWMNGL